MTRMKGKPVTKKQILFYVFALLFASLVLSGCSQEKAASPTSLEKPESASLIICRDYLGLVDEADTGIITDFELRERYKLIYEKAKTLNDSELLSGVTRTLAAVTRNNRTEYHAELRSFSLLCHSRLGYEKVMELLGNND
jgi:hypothetical protein